MLCVTTRFRLRSPLALLPMYLAYRRMQRDLEMAPGLVRHAFLIQSPVAVCTLSLWASRQALERFSNVPSHVAAVRHAKRTCRGIWSAYWELDALSRYASEWEGTTAFPELVPDEAQPWRLVLPGQATVRNAERIAPKTDATQAPAKSPRTTRAGWDWSRTRDRGRAHDASA